ncbi:MAG: 3TM-type holin [Alphaproteobacteria bacterium]|nr:3TM-type holin [Alphaproteobacteria bacterium]
MLPVVAALAPVLSTLIKRVLPDDEMRQKVENELAQTLITHASDLEKLAANAVLAETKGESWLQRNWRPMLMVLFGYIIAHNYVLAPLFGLASVRMPDHLWELLKIGIGGYIISRGSEKGIRMWRKADKSFD